VAAKLKQELATDIAMIHGHYGEFKVLVDDHVVSDGGLMAALGIVPSDESILSAVRKALTPAD
jgi:hypothetical protein